MRYVHDNAGCCGMSVVFCAICMLFAAVGFIVRICGLPMTISLKILFRFVQTFSILHEDMCISEEFV